MTAPADIPRYRALAPIFIRQYRHSDASSVPVGAEVEFEGEPAIDMVPLNAEAIAAKARAIRPIAPGAQNHRELFRLAASLGFSGASTWDEALAFMNNWKATYMPKDAA